MASFLYKILEDLIILTYVAYRAKGKKYIGFSRNAFKKDLEYFYAREKIALINSEFIRKIMSGLENDYLEQITCLYQKEKVSARLPLTRRYLDRNINDYVFGGVDYFEFVLFCPKRNSDANVDVIFHENYAIPYIEEVNKKMFNEIKNAGLWDDYKINQIRTYGPPAKRVLEEVSKATGSTLTQVKSPRIKFNTTSLENFDKPTILMYAYPGIEYLAPINFTTVLSRLNEIQNADWIVKFKGPYKTTAKKYNNVKLIHGGAIPQNDLRRANIGITFNSITFYEMLSSEMLILVPQFLDAQLPKNMLQYNSGNGNKLKTIRFLNSFEEIGLIVNEFDAEEHKLNLVSEINIRREAIRNAFYI